MPLSLADDAESGITAFRKQFSICSSKAQRRSRHIKLDSTVDRVLNQLVDQIFRILILELPKLIEQAPQKVVIHGTAIIWIGQTEVPDFRPLVEIRDTGRSDLQYSLRERVEYPGSRDPGLK